MSLDKTNQAVLNGKSCRINPGETILEFISRHLGPSAVPSLCKEPNLSAQGSCRLCSVALKPDAESKEMIVGSCHTPVLPGQIIRTHSHEILRLRRSIMELIISDHPLDCHTCEADGACDLQSVAADLGMDKDRYQSERPSRNNAFDDSHPFMRSDMDKCINCNLCVAACDELQGQFVLSMADRGIASHIVKDQDVDFLSSSCVACGACAQACPTSAISDKFKYPKMEAQDAVRTVCTYCGVGCNLEVAVHQNEVLNIHIPYDAEVNQGHACLKGRYAFQFYKHADRLKNAMVRRDDRLQEVSWEEAFDTIVSQLQEIKSHYGADAIAGISSSRCTNEENYLMQKFMRAVIGTNNIDGCARLCHAPTATGLQQTFGTGAATNSIKDLEVSDCILVVGANPTTAHPVTGAKIKQEAISGKTLIVIDPRKTELAQHADYHLQLRPGTNVAVLNMMLYYILSNQWQDDAFISKRCRGYQGFYEQVMRVDLDRLERVSGVPRKLVNAAAKAYALSPRAMSFHGLGVTEHHQGTFAVHLLADLAMVTGNIGRPGVGVNPLRGQNNVQGAADMGVQPNQGPGYLNVADRKARLHYQHHYGVPVPSGKGLTIPEMFDAALRGELKALWIMGEHVLQTEPNTEKVKKALSNLELLIVQELFLTETAQMAHVILPGASFLEKSGTFTNGERRVQQVNQVVEPIGNARSDGQIISEVMQLMGYPQPNYDHKQVLQEIAQIVPFFKGITWDRLGANGLQWPVDGTGHDTKILHTDTFKLGLGRLIFNEFEESPEIDLLEEGFPFILTTNRALEHYNCGTMTRRTDLNQLMDQDLLMINPQDAMQNGIEDGELIRLISARGQIEIQVTITDAVKPGILSTTFHFPEVLVNKLMGNVCDTESICPEYKVIATAVHKI